MKDVMSQIEEYIQALNFIKSTDISKIKKSNLFGKVTQIYLHLSDHFYLDGDGLRLMSERFASMSINCLKIKIHFEHAEIEMSMKNIDKKQPPVMKVSDAWIKEKKVRWTDCDSLKHIRLDVDVYDVQAAVDLLDSHPDILKAIPR